MSFLIEFQRLIWKNLTICVIALHVFISHMYLCRTIYNVTFQNDDENITYKVEVSYIEIYNEKVRDLLCPRGYVTNISFQVFLNPMCSNIILLSTLSPSSPWGFVHEIHLTDQSFGLL